MDRGGDVLGTARARGGFYQLPERVWLALSGADRERYLNGQVTNDVRKLKPGQAMQACIVSAKGKLDGIVFIWTDETRLIVEAEADVGEVLAARLDRYLVADDVEIEARPAGEHYHAFGEAATRLIEHGGGLRRVSRLGIDGVDCEAGDLSKMSAGEELSPGDVDVLRIEHVIPRWGAELTADTLPAEAGLDRTAVDFHKGCYIGQEVISRIQSVGRTNRLLASFVVTSDSIPQAGENLFIASTDEKPVGVITSVAEHFALPRSVGLCYIKRGQEEAAELISASGARLNLCELPCE